MHQSTGPYDHAYCVQNYTHTSVDYSRFGFVWIILWIYCTTRKAAWQGRSATRDHAQLRAVNQSCTPSCSRRLPLRVAGRRHPSAAHGGILYPGGPSWQDRRPHRLACWGQPATHPTPAGRRRGAPDRARHGCVRVRLGLATDKAISNNNV